MGNYIPTTIAGIAGVLVVGAAYMVRHYATVIIPKKDFDHAAAMERKDQFFRESIDSLVEQFKGDLVSQRNDHKEELKIFWEELKAERISRHQDDIAITTCIDRLTTQINLFRDAVAVNHPQKVQPPKRPSHDPASP